jgi:hypothetical protein
MDAGPRVAYIAFLVLAIILACLKMWWLAAACLACIGMTYIGMRMFEEPEDW